MKFQDGYKKRGNGPMKKRHLWTLLFLIPVLTACQMFPAEEALPAAPVIREYEAKEYKFSPVIRGDMVKTERINCKYVPTKQEQLAFDVNGEQIDEIYVMEGDYVEAGELVAQLVADNLAEQIAAQTYSIQVLEAQLRHVEENRVLELSRLETQKDDSEEYVERVQNTENSFALQKQSIADSLYIERMVLSELQEDYNARQLYAGMSGTVILVRDLEAGARSVKAQVLVTIADLSSTAFTVKGEDAQYFPVGTEVTITCNKKDMTAVSVEAAELGLPEPAEGEDAIAYLRLDNPDPTLEDGDSGRIVVTLDSREDTIYVNKNAVKMSDTGTFVYILNEEGLKVMQSVTTGLEADGYLEILSGLEEGDSVILE